MKDKFNFEISKKFIDYFDKRVKQVFFYTTESCHLRCKQCLYKPNLFFQMKQRKEIPLNEMIKLAEDFHKLGAIKATIMGGEPSKYGDEKHNDLCKFIAELRRIGYTYIRMDTNGQFEDDMLALDGMKELDEVSFSIDGYSPETNDILRGEGSFEKCHANIKRAVELGYTVDVTSCIHPVLLQEDANGQLNIEKMILFAQNLGVRNINFHVLFKHGFPMDTWTEDTAVTPERWIEARDILADAVTKNKYKIHVRIPYHFIAREEFDKNPKYYGYCPAKLGERLLVHPDGQIRICSGLISSKYCVAHYYDNKIVWEEGYLNELNDHDLNNPTPCTNQSKGMKCGNYCPLCFSFKPYQKEYVWKNKLKWEEANDQKCNIFDNKSV
jgi:MoaA/NifB/PqqE/SkfB family radical SAM enzyme